MSIDKIYKSIADNISNSIDESWSSAVLNVERAADDAISFQGGYKKGSDFYSFKFRKFDRRKLTSDFHLLHKIMADQNSSEWNIVDFSLQSNGRFNIQFSWNQDIDQS